MKEDSLSPDAGDHTNMRAVQNLKEMDKKREGSRSEEEHTIKQTNMKRMRKENRTRIFSKGIQKNWKDSSILFKLYVILLFNYNYS
jgi:hypothetical protein